jgi:hypothetical protein
VHALPHVAQRFSKVNIGGSIISRMPVEMDAATVLVDK